MARLFTNQISDYLIGIIQTAFPTLKTVAKGTMDELPSPALLADLAPGVIVEPGRVRVAPINTGQSFEIVYPFRIWYFRQYAAGEKVTEKLVQEAEALCEVLFDNFQLPGYSQPNCMGVHGYPTGIDYASDADIVLQALQVPVSLVSIDYEVHTQSRR